MKCILAVVFSIIYSRNMTGYESYDASLVGAYIVCKLCVNIALRTSKAIDVGQIWKYLERQRNKYEYQETRLTIAIMVGKLFVGGQRRKRRHPTRDVSGGVPAIDGAAGRCQSVRGAGASGIHAGHVREQSPRAPTNPAPIVRVRKNPAQQ